MNINEQTWSNFCDARHKHNIWIQERLDKLEKDNKALRAVLGALVFDCERTNIISKDEKRIYFEALS